MKTASSKLFFAMFFALNAQSFFLVARQQAILRGVPEALLVVTAVFLLVAGYFNLDLVLYAHSVSQERKVTAFSLFLSGWLLFLYFRAQLRVEGVLIGLIALSYGMSFFYKKPNDLKDAVMAANALVGLGFLLSEKFAGAPFYASIASLRFLFGGFFFFSALLALYLGDSQREGLPRKMPEKLLALPWIVWAFLFLKNFNLSILIPSGLTILALLTFRLIPFEKLSFPERELLGTFVFPIVAFLASVLQILFFILLRGVSEADYYIHDIVFAFSLLFSIFALCGIIKLHMAVSKLLNASEKKIVKEDDRTALEKFSERLLFIEWQTKKIRTLTDALETERKRSKWFLMLRKLRRQLDDQLDVPVAAQLVVNFIREHLHVGVVSILTYDADRRELSFLASAEQRDSGIPVGYKQSIDKGIIGRAARTRKTQIVNDTRLDKDYISVRNEKNLSELAYPLIYRGHLKGILLLGKKEQNAFSSEDVDSLDVVAEELLRTWEHTGYNLRLHTLIQANISLSTSLNTQTVIEEVAKIAQEALQARFVFVTLVDQDGSFTRTSSMGEAPSLHKFLSRDLASNPLLQSVLDAEKSFRVRDIRKYKHASSLALDHHKLRGLIVSPIRLHGVNIGAMLAFGKKDGVFFSEKDESLANLLSMQAAAAIESAWLVQELRLTSATTSALYQLSFGILQIDRIEDAAQLIAETALRLVDAPVAGIVLFSSQGEMKISLEVTAERINFNSRVPVSYVEQALAIGESITISLGECSARIYLPIQTTLQKYGVLWVEFKEGKRRTSSRTQTLQTLANQAAMGLERVMLLLDSRQKALELADAYKTLENTYDQTLLALMSALDARDRETEGHSARVARISELLGEELDLPPAQRQSLQRGSLLHDIGKIGISDAILNKAGKLTDDEWRVMRQHPSIGREIIKDIPFLQDAIPVVYAHHERWDGSGYPRGLRGTEIPLEARIFAVADIFDALTSVRSYRKGVSDVEALRYLQEKAGILVDPQVVAVFARLLERGEI